MSIPLVEPPFFSAPSDLTIRQFPSWKMPQNARAVVTTNYVMAELVALLTSPMRVPRREQIRIVATLRAADWIQILHVDFRDGWCSMGSACKPQ
ncbi:MAG TPA: hypothetical protein VGM43_15485 [Bryobacteraceae bacterium]